MFEIGDLLFLLLLCGAILFWWTSMQARQNAREAAKNICARYGVNLIDDTVERVRLRWQRDEQGRLVWQRDYQFEFSTDGARRYRGDIKMRGKRVIDVQMEAYASQESEADNVYRLPTHPANTKTFH